MVARIYGIVTVCPPADKLAVYEHAFVATLVMGAEGIGEGARRRGKKRRWEGSRGSFRKECKTRFETKRQLWAVFGKRRGDVARYRGYDILMLEAGRPSGPGKARKSSSNKTWNGGQQRKR